MGVQTPFCEKMSESILPHNLEQGKQARVSIFRPVPDFFNSQDVNACRNMIFLAKLILSGVPRPLLFSKSLKTLNADAFCANNQTPNNNE